MKNSYDNEFHKKIEDILNQIYGSTLFKDEKCKQLKLEDRHLEYLKNNGIITYIPNANKIAGRYCLTERGYQVFEKYDGWFDYKKKVIDRQEKYEYSKYLAQRFWWIPIIISVLALIIAIISLFVN